MRRRRDIDVLNHASFIDTLFLFIGALIFILTIVVLLMRDLNLFDLLLPGAERLPDAMVGRPYDFVLPIYGGNERYRCSLAGDPLVEGLRAKPTSEFADGTCGIEGTPARTTTVPIRIEFLVRDSVTQATLGAGTSAVQTIKRQFELTVLSPPPKLDPLQLLTSDLPVALAKRPYQLWLSAIGGVEPYRWVVRGGLPPGLSVDADSGLLAGEPGRLGIHVMDIRVADAAGMTTEWVPLKLSVLPDPDFQIPPPPPLRIHTRILPAATAGRFYEVALSATGGAPPYAWSVVGALPSGLTCCDGGYLSGTPAETGEVRFRIDVQSSASLLASVESASHEVALTVEAPPPVAPPLRLFR